MGSSPRIRSRHSPALLRNRRKVQRRKRRSRRTACCSRLLWWKEALHSEYCTRSGHAAELRRGRILFSGLDSECGPSALRRNPGAAGWLERVSSRNYSRPFSVLIGAEVGKNVQNSRGCFSSGWWKIRFFFFEFLLRSQTGYRRTAVLRKMRLCGLLLTQYKLDTEFTLLFVREVERARLRELVRFLA